VTDSFWLKALCAMAGIKFLTLPHMAAPLLDGAGASFALTEMAGP